jgi:hypothetical protein
MTHVSLTCAPGLRHLFYRHTHRRAANLRPRKVGRADFPLGITPFVLTTLCT